MAHLSLSLLGPFQATLDGQPVTRFESAKVRALLIYLAVEADRPHSRTALAGLLWPDWPDRAALRNLSYALSNLRQAIGDRRARPPFLLITHDTIQFNTASDYASDIAGFGRILGSPDLQSLAVDSLEQAINLYRGSFLEGFSCDSDAFEEWVLFKRERLGQQAFSALRRLAEHYERHGDYQKAAAHARKQLEMGAEMTRSCFLGRLAEACGKVGRIEEGLEILAEALAFVQVSDERFYEAELYRVSWPRFITGSSKDLIHLICKPPKCCWKNSQCEATNCVSPCPCGYYGDPTKECTCAPSMERRAKREKRGASDWASRLQLRAATRSEQLHLGARAFHRTRSVKIARTIADLARNGDTAPRSLGRRSRRSGRGDSPWADREDRNKEFGTYHDQQAFPPRKMDVWLRRPRL